MGDSSDGSSNAALSAQAEAPTIEKSGFFGRIVKALSPSDEGVDLTPETPDIPRPQTRGMINLRRMRVEDVAVPKAEIISAADDVTRDELVALFRDTGLTRVPIYQGTLDTPVGFVHLKDFALRHGFNGSGGSFSLKELLRPLLFVPPSMTIGVLLTKMQAERRHMALVIDEYGGVDGLVTIEDLIEQVIGEIEDEHDLEEDQYWVQESPGSYLAQAKTPLEDFEAEVGRSLSGHEDVDVEDVETLGGLVFTLSGNVPARGEVVAHPDGTEFEIVDADPRRIKRLRVRFTEAQDG
ncbi:hemolysin family protein [Shimia sediminis]|uniref:hemolysin family protein n=1 Tax=Shimia sediminis TaxID=2497945 RepID=UPI000F8F34F8|nr:hemolysin family protein [Shimia sediminis]